LVKKKGEKKKKRKVEEIKINHALEEYVIFHFTGQEVACWRTASWRASESYKVSIIP
jgi:hypothetical protein